MNLAKLDSFIFDNLKRRILKVLRYGQNDAVTAKEAGYFGFDSGPMKNMMAVYAPTVQKGEKVIIGYINLEQLAQPGETRVFSCDEQGVVKTQIWLRNNGTIEIGGAEDWMVRYSKLEEAFNEFQQKWNTFAAAYTPGSSSSVGTPPTAEESMADITEAKINEIRTL
jgi:hypothetical protein